MPRPKTGPPTGRLQKTLYVLQMNWHREHTKESTRLRHVRALRDECLRFISRTNSYGEELEPDPEEPPVWVRSIACEIGDALVTPDFERDPNSNEWAIARAEEILVRELKKRGALS